MTASRPTSAVVVGASSGIGSALIRTLAERPGHAPIFALSRSGSSVPQGVRTLPIDLSDEATIAAAAARVGEAGPVGLVIVATGLLHRAGVSPEKTVGALDPAAMATLFSVNTIGPALVAKHFVPCWRDGGDACSRPCRRGSDRSATADSAAGTPTARRSRR